MKRIILPILAISLITGCHSTENIEPQSYNMNQMNESIFLETYIFQGLKNLNDGFDAETIYYFSESDFEIVLNRAEKLGIEIYGIEPWQNGGFYDVKIYEDYETTADDPNWYQTAFAEFKKENEILQYAASYGVPTRLLQ